MTRRRQGKLVPDVRACVGCGASEQVGARQDERGAVVCSLSPLLYRRGLGKGGLRVGRRIHVCDTCLPLFASRTIDSRWMNIATALCESLSGLYKATLEGDTK